MNPIKNNINEQAIAKLLTELDHGDRNMWESLTQHEKNDFLEILTEFRDKGVSHKLNTLWEMDYRYKPVSIKEWLENEYYAGLWGNNLYDKWKEELCIILDPSSNINEWLISGGIGVGKSTAGIFSIAYKIYRLQCLRNPQKYHSLMDSTRIVFGMYSTTLRSANATWSLLFDIIDKSPFFYEKADRDRNLKNFLELPNKVTVTQGSNELHAISQNLLSILIDETNFMRKGQNAKNLDNEMGQAYTLYSATKRRIESRFMRFGVCSGLVVLISSRQTQFDFLEKHIEKNRDNPNVRISEFAPWDVKPWIYGKKRFKVEVGSKNMPSKILTENDTPRVGAEVIEIPEEHRKAFELDIDSSIRDIAGIAVYGISPLITVKESVKKSFSDNRQHPFTAETLTLGLGEDTELYDYLVLDRIAKIQRSRLIPLYYPNVGRTIHIDIGLTGDAFAICMSCSPLDTVSQSVSNSGFEENKVGKYVFVDFILQIKAPSGSEVDIEKARNLIYYLRDKLNFSIYLVTLDGFQSRDTAQLLLKNNIESRILSVDRKDDQYLTLRHAMVENRIACYPYHITEEELYFLQYDRYKGKIDHLPSRSKDTADALCGAVYNCTFAKEADKASQYHNIHMIQNKGEKSAIQKSWLLDNYTKYQNYDD